MLLVLRILLLSHHHWLLAHLHSHATHAAHDVLLAHVVHLWLLLHSHGAHHWLLLHMTHLTHHHAAVLAGHFRGDLLSSWTVHRDIVLSTFDILALNDLFHALVEI